MILLPLGLILSLVQAQQLTTANSTVNTDFKFLTNYSAITNVSDGAFYGLVEDLILTDNDVCNNYTLVLFWDFWDAVKLMMTDIAQGFETLGIVVHKSPLVYLECNRMFYDLEYIEFVFLLFNGKN